MVRSMSLFLQVPVWDNNWLEAMWAYTQPIFVGFPLADMCGWIWFPVFSSAHVFHDNPDEGHKPKHVGLNNQVIIIMFISLFF